VVCVQDRLCVCPTLGAADEGFFAVFDGTVGDFASETIHPQLIACLVNSQVWFHLIHFQKS
jgi:hypothetical protein